MKKFNYILLLVTVFVSCQKEKAVDKTTTLPFFNSAEFTPEWISKESKNYDKIHTIPSFSFTNQNGEQVTNDHYEGKIYVADFFFVTCPGICPRLTKNMRFLQKEFKDDDSVLLLSHTVMPVRDSVPVLKEYGIENKIDSKKWNLVTGNKEGIYDIARTGYFTDEDFVKTQDKEAFIHTENFVLVDTEGRIRGVYNGTLELEVKRLIKHIKMLKKEIR